MNGTIIKAKIESGHKFIVRMRANSKYDKYVIKFELWDPTDDHYFEVTKFQAIKYLSPSQLEAVKVFEDIYAVFESKSHSFGRYLDGIKRLENLAIENELYSRILKAANPRMFTALKF